METITSIAKINNVQIVMLNDQENHIPIKPICEALGIAFQPQILKVQNDEILGSVVTLKVTTGSDGKQYEMTCIPLMFVFGWLFTINPKNVKPEAQEAVTRYKLECYKALFNHFTDQSEFLKQKQVATAEQFEEVERIRTEFKNTRIRLEEAKMLFQQIKAMTFDEWKANNNQLKLELKFDAESAE